MSQTGAGELGYCWGHGRRAVIVGTSDGIGLALTRRLLADGWRVVGVSRSPGRIEHAGYQHVQCDVASDGYVDRLTGICADLGVVDLCVYCAGIGEGFDPEDLTAEGRVFAVNLAGAVSTVQVVGASMVAQGVGHFVGLSSMADRLVSGASPSYSASKAGLSSYLRSLAFALRPAGVYVTNIRFGFVDTKMAKSPIKPMMISADQAAGVVLRCLKRRPIQVSYPKRMAWLVAMLGWLGTLRVLFGRVS